MHTLPGKKVDLDLTTPGGVREYLKGTAFETTQEPVGLTGGFGNFTYRVALEAPAIYETIIVKHAAPFVASYPDWPLDPARMDVEYHALNTIGSNSSLASQSVRVPTVYAFDPINHVLIMEDIGTSPSLKDFVSSLPDSAHPEKVISQVGELLGSYLARLHNWGLGVSSNGKGEDELAVFRNNTVARNVCAERTAGRLLATAKQFGIELNEGEKIVQAMQREIKENEETFNMGDFWPGNIFVKLQEDSPGVTIYVIDWELAKTGPSSSDLGQFLGEAYLLLHFRSKANSQNLIGSFIRSYQLTRVRHSPVDIGSVVRDAGAHVAVWAAAIPWGDGDSTKSAVAAGFELLKIGESADRDAIAQSAFAELIAS